MGERWSSFRLAQCFAAALWLAAPAAAPASASGTEGAPAVAEELRLPHDRTYSVEPGAPRRFRISLRTGELLAARLQEEAGDAVLAFQAPGGLPELESDLAHAAGEAEEILWVARQPGAHLLEVRLAPGAVAAASVRLVIEAPRPAAEEDRSRAGAHAITLRAYMALGRGSRQDLEQAEELFRRSLAAWRELGDLPAVVDTLGSLARIVARFGRHEESDGLTREALSLNRELGRPEVQAVLLNNHATSLQGRGRYREASDAFFESVALARDAGDLRGQAFGLLNAGTALDRLGRPWDAHAAYEEARPLAEQASDVRLRIALLLRLGTLEWYSGEPEVARGLLEEGLELARGSGHRMEQANLLVNLGRLRLELGDHERAHSLLQESLVLWQVLGVPQGEAEARRALGRLAFEDGETEAAAVHLEATRELCRRLESLPCEAAALADVGQLELESAPLAAIASLEASRTLWQRLEGGRRESETLALLGRARRLAGQPQAARQVLEEALETARRTRHGSVEVAVLAELGELAAGQGDLPAARRRFRETLQAMEELRARLASPALRATLVGSRRSRVLRLVDVLFEISRRGFDSGAAGEALAAAEAVRARALLDRLRELGTPSRAQVPRELLHSEQELRRRVTLLDARRLGTGLAGPPDPEGRRRLEEQLDEALVRLDEVAAEVRSAGSSSSPWRQAEPLDEASIRALLDPGTVLLEFLLGEPRSYLWRVSAEATSVHALPGEGELHVQVEAVRELAEQSRRRAAKVPFERAAAALAASLLGPIAGQLDAERLVLVPDGFLAAVPFAALPHPAATDGAPLIADRELVVLPSASSLAYLRGLADTRRPAAPRAAILADPVFDRRDPRLAGLPTGAGEVPAAGLAAQLEATRSSAHRAGLRSFHRLPHSRDEAAQLRALLAPGELDEALGFAAAKEVFFQRDLAANQVLHFATHAFVDDLRPDLSGIVLSLVDRQGQPLDGVLRLHEIYGLDLASELVVLSACQTALGRDLEGEGPLGLARGFLYAGAPALVATLWQVGDRASAELMRRFYRALARPGVHPAGALQEAQRSMAADPEWSAPYFWAGFVFQGDWQRPLSLLWQQR